MAQNIYRVPLFLEAKSKLDLSIKMKENNVKHKKEFGYFDIQKDGKKWVAWFYADLLSYGQYDKRGGN